MERGAQSTIQRFKMEHKKDSDNKPETSRTQLYKTSTVNLSRAAKQRLKWMDHFLKYRNARLTCRHFGISPDTFYLWRKRFAPKDPSTLEDDLKTRRPRNLRVSKQSIAHEETIINLKKLHPRLSKVKIAKMIQETGYAISSSTVGRILKKTLLMD